jgi:hypothetical protein
VGKPVDRWGRIVEPDELPPLMIRPQNDGSGLWWEIRDRRAGVPLWTIEAWSFEAARAMIASPRKLSCASRGVPGTFVELRPSRQRQG